MAVYQLVLCSGMNVPYQDITTIALDKRGGYRLSRPAVWTFRVPASLCPAIRKGHRLKVRRDGVIVFNGIVMFVQREGDENTVWISVTCVDPRIIWGNRPLRDDNGTFAFPTFGQPVSGGELIKRAVDNSIYNPGDPEDSFESFEGQMGLTTAGGQFDTAIPPAVDLSIDDLIDWPITIADLAELLINTGMVDIEITPIDQDSGDLMGIVNAVNQWGSDLSGSVHLDFATGDFSVKRIRHTEDMSTLCNKLWYYLGPKKTLRRWRANITGSVDAPPSWEDPALADLMVASRGQYNIWADIRVYDSGDEFNLRDMYRQLWQTEVLLRVNGREMLAVQPKPEASFLPFEDYNLGDIITINSGSTLGISLSAQQRIYGFDVEIDREGVERPGELIASADGLAV